MRNLVASTCALLVLTACPSDDGSDDTGAGTDMTTMSGTGMSGTGMSGTGMSSMSSTTDATTGMSTSGMTSAEDDSTTSGGDTSAGGGPTINSITWTQAAGCTMGTGSDVEIVVDATDPDNDPSELTVSGLIVGCTGEVDSLMATILCPQVAPYTGTVTVADPDGNEDDLDITIEPCADGSAMP